MGKIKCCFLKQTSKLFSGRKKKKRNSYPFLFIKHLSVIVVTRPRYIFAAKQNTCEYFPYILLNK